MATATAPQTKPTAIDPRVSHPLDQLRGIIRRYVVIEGLLLAVLFLAGWFTLALLLDFGLFRTTVWDWVLDAPRALRVIALVVALGFFAALITKRIVRRLTKELSYPSLALVLERRFPRQLGDRLITAVELADVSLAAQNGYSIEMVKQTIAEAKSRVAEVPVREVFNWKRLWRLGFCACALLMGILIVGYAAFAISTKSTSPYRYAWRFAHVSGTLLERDLLLQNTPWPRQAHLVLLGFPESEPLRIGKDGGAPSVRVRSYRYLIADSNERLGWRPLQWNDLNADYAGETYPTDPFVVFKTVDGIDTTGASEWRVDDVFNRMEAVASKTADARRQIGSLDAKAESLQAELRTRTAEVKKQAEDLKATAAIKMAIATERKDAKDAEERLKEAKDMEAEALRLERNHVEIAITAQVLIKKGDDKAPAAQKWLLKPADSLEWRPLRWRDLNTALKIGTAKNPPSNALVENDGLGDGITIGVLEGILPRVDKHLEPVRAAFTQLDEVCDQPSMGRTIRRLDAPGKVVLEYVGKTKTGEASLNAEQNNEYAGQITDLKEDIRFQVKAENFRTEEREIHLINPPMFEKLIRTDFQPAYLYHAPPVEDGYEAFRADPSGKSEPLQTRGEAPLQRMRDMPLSLTGDRTVFSVPVGTAVTLTGIADTELRAAYIEPRVGTLPGAVPGSKTLIPIPVGADGHTVTVDLSGDYRLTPNRDFVHVYLDEAGWLSAEQVTSTPTLEFDIVLEQKYGVTSRRQVMIQTLDDEGPDVNVPIDGVRKVSKLQVFVNNKLLDVSLPVPCYLVTPEAVLEFNPDGIVRDDHGLSKVAFEGKYWQQSYQEETDRAKVIEAPPERREDFSAAVPQFGGVSIGRPRAELRKILGEPLRDEIRAKQATLLEFRNPDLDVFDVSQLNLAAEDKRKGQLHYRVDLGIVATDANFATGPRTGRNREPINLLLVSEAELRMAMNADDDALAKQMASAVKSISESRTKFDFVKSQNGVVPLAEVSTSRLKADEIVKDLYNTRNIVQGVLADCRRLQRECRINRVSEASISRYGRLANRLDRVLGGDPLAVNDAEAAAINDGSLKPMGTFPESDAVMAEVFSQLIAPGMGMPSEGRWADPALIARAELALANLEQELTSIQTELGKSSDYKKTIEDFEQMVRGRLRQTKELEEWLEKVQGDLNKKEVTLRPPASQFLGKGETKKFKLNIAWNQYPKDDVVVKLESSDKAAIIVPETVKLNFEEHQTDFEIEVKAAQLAGEYTITLTPEAGKPAQMIVKVR